MGSYAMDKVGGLQEARDKPEQILQSNTDAEAWNLEVERVAPQLKVDKIYEYVISLISEICEKFLSNHNLDIHELISFCKKK